jgi:hypothetical protein
MPTKRPPRDVNELAKYVVDVTTGKADKIEPPKKNPAAVALAALGASRGGKARARILTKKRKKEIAKKAAKARWAPAKHRGR